jgi:hypothetical protein
MSDDARDTCCQIVGAMTWLDLPELEVVVEVMGD